jgi:hypothetical protein
MMMHSAEAIKLINSGLGVSVDFRLLAEILVYRYPKSEVVFKLVEDATMNTKLCWSLTWLDVYGNSQTVEASTFHELCIEASVQDLKIFTQRAEEMAHVPKGVLVKQGSLL